MSAPKPWMELKPILLPPDWTAEKDFQFYDTEMKDKKNLTLAEIREIMNPRTRRNLTR